MVAQDTHEIVRISPAEEAFFIECNLVKLILGEQEANSRITWARKEVKDEKTKKNKTNKEKTKRTTVR